VNALPQAAQPPPDDEPQGSIDAGAAEALLTSTTLAARQGFETRGPLVLAFLSIVVLSAYGTLWWSVRDQNPYVGPSLGAIGAAYAIVMVSVVVSLGAYTRARDGVRAAHRSQDVLEGLALGVPWLAVFVFDGALRADGFSFAIVYGVFDAAAPWLVVGAALAGLGAGRRDTARLAIGLGLVLAATVAAFFGPAGSWAVLGAAGFAGLAAMAVIQRIRMHRP